MQEFFRPRHLISARIIVVLVFTAARPGLVQAADNDNAAAATQRSNSITLPAAEVTAYADSPTTEGSGSYTTSQTSAATRLPLSLRETPQAVSVITRQRMDDQKLDSLQSVLENTTGISPVRFDTERASFYSRGFLIDSIQYDGIPSAIGSVAEGSGINALDTAFYDRVEVVRGSTGLLTGAGNPSASINLVRKRPTQDPSAAISLSAGRWDSDRAMADVSTPLTDDGRIRARLVGVKQDSHSYIDRYQQHKNAFYGVIEADLTADTTVSAGYDYQDMKPKYPTWGGSPLWFSNGQEATWSRAKSMAADWSRWDNTLKTAFVDIERRFDNGWKLKAVLTQYRTETNSALLTGYGAADRATGLGGYPDGVYPTALQSTGDTRENALDAMASGPFELAGRQHELVVGAMGSRYTSGTDAVAPFIASITPINVYDWDRHFAKPDFASIPSVRTNTRIKQTGLYSAARFSLADDLKFILGGRLSQYEVDETVSGVPFHYKKSAEFTPYAGLIYAIDSTYSAYVSYTGIFNPQTSYRDANGNVLTPTQGNTREIGLKGEYLEGRLNASVAVFDTALDNAAQIDSGKYTSSGAQAYQAVDGTKSRGVEFDVQGELAAGWNLYAGVAHFRAQDGNDERLNPQLPRTTGQFFTTYRLPADWQKLTVGGGVRWQSSFYQTADGVVSTREASQQAYALASLMMNYAFTEKIDVGVNVSNLFDKKYATQKGTFDTVTYGEPRNLVATLNYRF